LVIVFTQTAIVPNTGLVLYSTQLSFDCTAPCHTLVEKYMHEGDNARSTVLPLNYSCTAMTSFEAELGIPLLCTALCTVRYVVPQAKWCSAKFEQQTMTRDAVLRCKNGVLNVLCHGKRNVNGQWMGTWVKDCHIVPEACVDPAFIAVLVSGGQSTIFTSRTGMHNMKSEEGLEWYIGNRG